MATIEPRARLFTRPFALITLGALAYFTAYAMGIPTLPLFVREELGGGKVAVGLVAGAWSFTALVMRPYAGILADRHGRRLPIVLGASIFGVSTLGMTFITSVPEAVALRLFAGIGEAMFFVGSVAAINDMAPPERRGEAISLFSVSLYLGIAFGPTGGEALREARGFDSVWIVTAGLFVFAALIGLSAPNARGERASHRFLHPAGIVPGAVMFTSVVGFAGFLAFLPLYVKDDLHLSGSKGILLMYGAILVAIRLFGARIPDRFGVARVGRVGLALSLIGLLTMGLWGSVAGLVVGAIVFGCGQAFAFPAYMALAANSAPPAERGAAVGTATAFIDLGFGVGPVLLGVVADVFGNRATFLVSACFAAAGVVLQAALAKRAR